MSAGRHREPQRQLAAMLVVGLLGLLALGVFVLLPRWVEDGTISVASGGGADTGAAPASAPAPPTTLPAPGEAEQAGSPAGEAEPAPAPEEGPEALDSIAVDPPRVASAQPPHPDVRAPTVPADRVPFVEAMSLALEALAVERFPAAKKAFDRALLLDPTSEAAIEGLAQAVEGVRVAALARHRDRGRSLESQEAWGDAVTEYEHALSLDASVRFAVVGLERAATRADLDASLALHLGRPGRLSDETVNREAARSVERARAVADPGPRLQRQVATLAVLVEQAAIPVPVVLESDELTEVTVYRVGRLGAFARHELSLKPGTYVVVGQRRGFRDVRRELVVRPGESPSPLVVRCEEAI